MRGKTAVIGSAVALSLVLALNGYAGVSESRARQLGESLTPFGADKDGNGKDPGTGRGIPAWTGGIEKEDIPESYEGPGDHHPSPWPEDEVLFTIDNENKDQYADKLPDGVIKMMETYPDTFEVPVYRSRRSHSAPQWVNENTQKNAVRAQLEDTGVDQAFGGIPFPIPHGSNNEKARQIMWNHKLRWRGVYVVRRSSETAVQRNGDYNLVTSQQEVYFRYYDPELSFEELNNIIFYYLSFTKAPARLAGGAVVVHETLDQQELPRQAWGYNAGQRRVRRAPNLSYDTPIAGADGLRTADDTDMYNGAMDKYNWELVHPEPVEMYIPYNNYEISSDEITYEQLLMPGHTNPDYQRWELHRVWVVEGTLKEGERHVYQKRRFYIDTDSWQIAVADQYDRRGELWRVSIAYIKNYYEVPTTWSALDTYHDLRSQRYHLQLLDNEESSTLDFTQPVPSPRYFHPAALRRRGR